jgi:hypothetical protein
LIESKPMLRAKLVEVPGELVCLPAPDGFLHFRREVLHAEREAVEAELAQQYELLPVVTRGSISMAFSASGSMSKCAGWSSRAG